MPVRTVRAAAVALTALALVATVSASAPAKTLGTNNLPITNAAGTKTFGVLSHRGGGLQWPENSVEAFENSVAAGFDAIEADVLFTSDGQAVMSHYDLLPERCLQPAQAPQSLHLMTAAQAAEVRCANLAGEKIVPLATFADLAAALARNPEVGLSLDIKSYTGQTVAEQKLYAARAMQLIKDHGLLSRTTIISFSWWNHLPVIRKAAPKMYVVALDKGTMDLDRVRLADRLKASGYGIRMLYTSEYLVQYTKARGMDAVPWEVLGDEQRAFAIHYGAKLQLFSTDEPTTTRAQLVAGQINLNPTPVPTVTPLATPLVLSQQKYTKNKRVYPLVSGKAVPKVDVAQLRSVTLSITVTGGKGKGRLYVGGMSTPLKSSTSVKLPKGSKTYTFTSPLGDKGKLRIYTTATVRLTVTAVAYTRVRFV